MTTRGKYVKWKSPKAVNTVKRCVKESPGDLKVAFQKAAEQLGTSVNAVSQAWHGMIKFKTRGYSTRAVKVAKVETPVVEVTTREPVEVSAPQEQLTNGPIYETVVSTQEIEGMRVVTLRQYFAI